MCFLKLIFVKFVTHKEKMPEVIYETLGLIDYKEAWDYQVKIFRSTVNLKISV